MQAFHLYSFISAMHKDTIILCHFIPLPLALTLPVMQIRSAESILNTSNQLCTLKNIHTHSSQSVSLPVLLCIVQLFLLTCQMIVMNLSLKVQFPLQAASLALW